MMTEQQALTWMHKEMEERVYDSLLEIIWRKEHHALATEIYAMQTWTSPATKEDYT
jgi:acid stress-induced BolA-like protein IbaG/YrbA